MLCSCCGRHSPTVTVSLLWPQIVVSERRKAFYHFITTLCAIVGGVFTVAGILDGVLHQSVNLAKKMELGKQVSQIVVPIWLMSGQQPLNKFLELLVSCMQ